MLRGNAKPYQWADHIVSLPEYDDVCDLTSGAVEAEIAVALGPVSGGLVAVDFDYEPAPGVFEKIKAILPNCEIGKRGAKGFTLFYRSSDIVTKTKWSNPADGQVIVEVLTRGQYTVIPPSVHPDTGKPYVWLDSEKTLVSVPLADLPTLTKDDLAKIDALMVELGYAAAEKPAPVAEHVAPVDRGVGSSDPFKQANDAAMADYDAWVMALPWPVPPVRGAGYIKAVPFWRPNKNGLQPHQRSPSLSFGSRGIKDNSVGKGYSPLDVVVAAQGVSESEALTWLQDRLGLTVETHESRFDKLEASFARKAAQEVAAQAGATLSASDAPVTGETAPTAPPDDPYAGLYDCRGLVGDIVRHITDTAMSPIPLHALGAALCIVGTAAGRRYRGPTKSSCVLYVANVAESGAGKEHALESAKAILRAAGLGEHVGPGEYDSGSAYLKTLKRKPLCLSAIDEFGSVWEGMNNPKSTAWMGKMNRAWKTQWGKNFGTLDTSVSMTSDAVEIVAPHWSVIGASTPGQFWQALRGAKIEDGSLNRMLAFQVDRVESASRIPPDVAVPERIVTLLKAIYGDQLHPHRNDISQLGHVIDVPFADGAESYWLTMESGFKAKAKDPVVGLFFKRSAEMSLRIATIRAIGINPLDPVVTVEDMEWGAWLVGLSTRAMVRNATDFIADTDNQAQLKDVRRIIKSAGGTISRSALVKKLDGKLKAFELDGALKLLIEAGDVEEKMQAPGDKGGRPGKFYVLTATA